MKESTVMSLNPLVNYLKKSPKEFTKADMIKFVEENEIKMINFHYVAGDGRLKTLGFILNSRDYLEQILSNGERVDGSNIVPAFIHAGSSDLYVIPPLSTRLRKFRRCPSFVPIITRMENRWRTLPNTSCARPASRSRT